MALPADFSKIYGSTATGGLTPISDVNYAKGWEFVGSNPPTKNDFSYLQNLSDLKSQWLYSNKLQRTNPFGDIKADGAAAVSTALANLGLGDAVHLANFTSGTGWRKTPDGYIEVWGQSAVANSSTGVAVATFPIPFHTECLSVQINEVTNSSSGVSGVKSWGLCADTISKTGVSGILNVTGSPATGEFFLYKAIGR